MTLTIGSWTYNGGAFTAQPFGYEATDTAAGLTARTCKISALLRAPDWATLNSVYSSWRDNRINDPDSKTSNSIGTTVSVSFSANGITWNSVRCWFSDPPSGDQYGDYVQATVVLVDAVQALKVLQAQDAKSKDTFYFGTITFGGASIKLLRPPETYGDIPQMSMSAGGESYISGPAAATKYLDIEGHTSHSGWNSILNWCRDATSSSPSSGDWFPITGPRATAEARIENGVRVDVYTVYITAGEAR